LENQLVVSENGETLLCIIRAQKLRERGHCQLCKCLQKPSKLSFCDWSTFSSVSPSLDAGENVPTFTFHGGFLFDFSPVATVHAPVATVLGSFPASVGTVESEGRQMKQC
jgi:hypothetical protein